MASSSDHWGPSAHPWERDDYGDTSEEELDPKEEAARELVNILAELYLESKIGARHLCEACYWAARAGVSGGMVEDYAVKPGQSSGNYQRHVSKAMGFDREERGHYIVATPGCPRGEAFGRHQLELPFRPPHELLQAELEADDSSFWRLQESLHAGRQPPAYLEH
eukprot:12789634-Alexandrium_andersonii.AAC.1